MIDAPAQRIDKWLWHARFARTRGLAQALATSGHVRVNRDKIASASRLVRVGDVLTIALGGGVAVVRVRAIAERRGSAAAAADLYAREGGSDPTEAATERSAPLRVGGKAE